MALTLEELQDIQADAMADDVDIVFDRMKLWTAAQAAAYFESGGTEPPDDQVTTSASPALAMSSRTGRMHAPPDGRRLPSSA